MRADSALSAPWEFVSSGPARRRADTRSVLRDRQARRHWLLFEKFFCPLEEALAQRRVLVAAQRGEFFKLPTLFGIQSRWHLDDQAGEQIAAVATVDIWNSFSTEFEKLTALRAGRHFQMRFAF